MEWVNRLKKRLFGSVAITYPTKIVSGDQSVVSADTNVQSGDSKATQSYLRRQSADGQVTETYTPIVEHPIMTIQEKVTKLEELYRSMDEKLRYLATQESQEEIKAYLLRDMAKESTLMLGLAKIDDKIEELERERGKAREQDDILKQQITVLETDKNIFTTIASTPLTSKEIAEKLGLTRQYVWERLNRLADAGYIEKIGAGKATKYRYVG